MDRDCGAGLTRRDLLLLATFCLVFFGTFLCNPQTANVHETVTRQNTREMLSDGDWIVPHLGGRPWLERPPLPFWLTAGFVAVLGDRDWVYPLAPILLSTGIVLMVAWMASLWFGRNVALMTGMILATAHEFYCYATGTESDIFLCFFVTAALALFVRLEFRGGPAESERRFLGRRSLPVLAFFVALGLTNLTKGLGFGTVLAVLPVGGFLLIERLGSLRRYCWLWGWLAFAAVALPWPILVYLRYPDVIDFWSSDYVERSLTEAAETRWYYLINLPWMLVPWTLPAAVGLWLTRPGAKDAVRRGRWFLFLWAVLPLAVLSFARHKHHHYLLHALAPWAVYGAIGSVFLWQKFQQAPSWLRHPVIGSTLLGLPVATALVLLRSRVPGPGALVPIVAVGWLICAGALWRAFSWSRGVPAFAVTLSVVCGLRLALSFGEGLYLDHYCDDRAFLQRACELVPADRAILVNGEDGALCASWWLHYGRGRTRLLHNLTFLRDDRLDPTEVYLIARRRFTSELSEYGTPEVVSESRHSKHELEPGDRYTLFRLHYYPGLARRSAQVHISPLQATLRVPGPFLD